MSERVGTISWTETPCFALCFKILSTLLLGLKYALALLRKSEHV
jgi:hypothetical protein